MSGFTVAADSPYFAGHFPGRPILPGISALWLAIEALAADRGEPARLRAVHSARLRQLIGPGDRIEVHAREVDETRRRVDLMRDGTLVANADLTFGEPAPIDGEPIDIEGASPRTLPPLDALLPHRPPMRFPTAIRAVSDDGLAASARIPRDCALVRATTAPAIACVEAAAQAAALWEAVRRASDPSGAAGARIGYLVALRDLAFGASEVPVEAEFAVAVTLEALALPLTHYRIEARDASGRMLVAGRIATVLA